MTKKAMLVLLCSNLVGFLAAFSLALFVSSLNLSDTLALPRSDDVAKRLDATAARLASHSSQPAIAEVLHRDESFIRSLVQIGIQQQELLFWAATVFAALAVINLLYVAPAIFQQIRNAS